MKSRQRMYESRATGLICGICGGEPEVGLILRDSTCVAGYRWRTDIAVCRACLEKEKEDLDWSGRVPIERVGANLPTHQTCADCGQPLELWQKTDEGCRITNLKRIFCSTDHANHFYYRSVTHKPKPYDHCGELFTPKRSTARFCSTKCRVAAHRAATLNTSDLTAD